MESWKAGFGKVLAAAAKKAGCPVPKFEGCATERTWGDRCGLVFFGESEEVCERAAKFFEKWAAKNLRKQGVVGGYNCQESISFEGRFYYAAYANGAKGWYRVRKETVLPVEGAGESFEVYGEMFHNKCVEMKIGYATSYVYYPCAE